MEKIKFMDKYPIYTKEILKSQTKISNVDEFMEILKQKIEKDDIATFISIFDHYNHTKVLGGEIMPGIIARKILIFCFGQELLNPLTIAIRPRNIGVAEFNDKFVVSFLEAPKEEVNNKKITWILENIIS